MWWIKEMKAQICKREKRKRKDHQRNRVGEGRKYGEKKGGTENEGGIKGSDWEGLP